MTVFLLFFVFLFLLTPNFLFSQWKVGAIVLFLFAELFSSSDCFIWPGRAESAAREKEREERVSKEYLNMILQIFYFLFLHFKLFQHFHPGETDQRGTRGGKKTQIGRAQTTCKFFIKFLMDPSPIIALPCQSVKKSVLMLNFVQLGFVEVVTASTDKYQVLTFCPNWICKAQTNTEFWQLFCLAGSASTEVPWAAGGVEKETHWRAEEQRHGQKSTGLSISWKTFLRKKIKR